MNRPTIFDFEFIEGGFNYEAYSKELDKHCDELEKALERACERLAFIEETTALNYEYHETQLWKDWALEDE